MTATAPKQPVVFVGHIDETPEKNHMVRIAVGLLLIMCCSSVAHSDSTNSDPAMELSKLYIQRQNTPQNWLDQILVVYVDNYRSIVEDMVGHDLTPDEEARLRSIFKESLLKLVPESLWEKEMAAVFRKHLSDDEIEETLAFYSTPAGQKLLRVQTESGVEAGQAIARVFRAGQEEFLAETGARILESFPAE